MRLMAVENAGNAAAGNAANAANAAVAANAANAANAVAEWEQRAVPKHTAPIALSAP